MRTSMTALFLVLVSASWPEPAQGVGNGARPAATAVTDRPEAATALPALELLRVGERNAVISFHMPRLPGRPPATHFKLRVTSLDGLGEVELRKIAVNAGADCAAADGCKVAAHAPLIYAVHALQTPCLYAAHTLYVCCQAEVEWLQPGTRYQLSLAPVERRRGGDPEEEEDEVVGDHSPPLALTTLASTASSSLLEATPTPIPAAAPTPLPRPAASGQGPPMTAAPCGACNTTNGHCAAGLCACHEGWTGLSCDICLAGAICYSGDEDACGGRGMLTAGGVCQWDQGRTGPGCTERDLTPPAVTWDMVLPRTVGVVAGMPSNLASPVAATPLSGSIAVLTRGLSRLSTQAPTHPPSHELSAELIQLNLTNLEMATICPASNHMPTWKQASHATAAAAQTSPLNRLLATGRRLLMGSTSRYASTLAEEGAPPPSPPQGDVPPGLTEEVAAMDPATGLVLTGGGGPRPTLFLHDPNHCAAQQSEGSVAAFLPLGADKRLNDDKLVESRDDSDSAAADAADAQSSVSLILPPASGVSPHYLAAVSASNGEATDVYSIAVSHGPYTLAATGAPLRLGGGVSAGLYHCGEAYLLDGSSGAAMRAEVVGEGEALTPASKISRVGLDPLRLIDEIDLTPLTGGAPVTAIAQYPGTGVAIVATATVHSGATHGGGARLLRLDLTPCGDAARAAREALRKEGWHREGRATTSSSAGLPMEVSFSMELDASFGSVTSLALDPRGGLSYAATTEGMLLRFDPDSFELVGIKHVAIGESLVLWAMLPGSDGLVGSSRPNAARERAGLDEHDAADVATSSVLATVADGVSRLLHLCVTAGGCPLSCSTDCGVGECYRGACVCPAGTAGEACEDSAPPPPASPPPAPRVPLSSAKVTSAKVGVAGRASVSLSWTISPPTDPTERALFYVIFATPIQDAWTTFELAPPSPPAGGALDGGMDPAVVRERMPWATLTPEAVPWGRVLHGSARNFSSLASPLGPLTTVLVPNITDPLSCAAPAGCTLELGPLFPRTKYVVVVELLTSKGADFAAAPETCTHALTQVCTSDPCCLCDDNGSVLACASPPGMDAALGGGQQEGNNASQEANAFQCDMRVCPDAQYCLCGQHDEEILACGTEPKHPITVPTRLAATVPANLVPPACVPGELVACVQVAAQLARWVAYGAVGAAPAVCYAEEPTNASGGVAALQAYAACADGTKYTNIGGESAESYPPVKAPRAVVTAFCAPHGGLPSTGALGEMRASSHVRADGHTDEELLWRQCPDAHEQEGLTPTPTPTPTTTPGADGAVAGGGENATDGSLSPWVTPTPAEPAFLCVSEPQARAIREAAAAGAGAAVADALTQRLDATSADLQAAAETGAHAAAGASLDQSCPLPPAPPPAPFNLPPPPPPPKPPHYAWPKECIEAQLRAMSTPLPEDTCALDNITDATLSFHATPTITFHGSAAAAVNLVAPPSPPHAPDDDHATFGPGGLPSTCPEGEYEYDAGQDDAAWPNLHCVKCEAGTYAPGEALGGKRERCLVCAEGSTSEMGSGHCVLGAANATSAGGLGGGLSPTPTPGAAMGEEQVMEPVTVVYGVEIVDASYNATRYAERLALILGDLPSDISVELRTTDTLAPNTTDAERMVLSRKGNATNCIGVKFKVNAADIPDAGRALLALNSVNSTELASELGATGPICSITSPTIGEVERLPNHSPPSAPPPTPADFTGTSEEGDGALGSPFVAAELRDAAVRAAHPMLARLPSPAVLASTPPKRYKPLPPGYVALAVHSTFVLAGAEASKLDITPAALVQMITAALDLGDPTTLHNNVSLVLELRSLIPTSRKLPITTPSLRAAAHDQLRATHLAALTEAACPALDTSGVNSNPGVNTNVLSNVSAPACPACKVHRSGPYTAVLWDREPEEPCNETTGPSPTPIPAPTPTVATCTAQCTLREYSTELLPAGELPIGDALRGAWNLSTVLAGLQHALDAVEDECLDELDMTVLAPRLLIRTSSQTGIRAVASPDVAAAMVRDVSGTQAAAVLIALSTIRPCVVPPLEPPPAPPPAPLLPPPPPSPANLTDNITRLEEELRQIKENIVLTGDLRPVITNLNTETLSEDGTMVALSVDVDMENVTVEVHYFRLRIFNRTKKVDSYAMRRAREAARRDVRLRARAAERAATYAAAREAAQLELDYYRSPSSGKLGEFGEVRYSINNSSMPHSVRLAAGHVGEEHFDEAAYDGVLEEDLADLLDADEEDEEDRRDQIVEESPLVEEGSGATRLTFTAELDASMEEFYDQVDSVRAALGVLTGVEDARVALNATGGSVVLSAALELPSAAHAADAMHTLCGCAINATLNLLAPNASATNLSANSLTATSLTAALAANANCSLPSAGARRSVLEGALGVRFVGWHTETPPACNAAAPRHSPAARPRALRQPKPKQSRRALALRAARAAVMARERRLRSRPQSQPGEGGGQGYGAGWGHGGPPIGGGAGDDHGAAAAAAASKDAGHEHGEHCLPEGQFMWEDERCPGDVGEWQDKDEPDLECVDPLLWRLSEEDEVKGDPPTRPLCVYLPIHMLTYLPST